MNKINFDLDSKLRASFKFQELQFSKNECSIYWAENSFNF